jgi:thermopsin
MQRRAAAYALLVVAALIASSAGALEGHRPAPSSPHPLGTSVGASSISSPVDRTPTPVAPGPHAEASLESRIVQAHVPTKVVYPPNLLYPPQLRNGVVVHPGYNQAPAPMGISDMGVTNTSGTPGAYTIDTTSYTGSLTVMNASPFYLGFGVPESFGAQLNVILRNVTVLGASTYTYWTQDVFAYDAYGHEAYFLDNIWNFSGPPPLPMPASTFHSGNGSVVPSVGFYYDLTPLFSIRMPFTVQFWINTSTTTTSGVSYTTVTFGYNLLNGAGVSVGHDTYDRVLFNNAGTAPIPQAKFHVDGQNLSPTGYIPYDAELDLGGPGGGSTANFEGLSATMSLHHLDLATGKYVGEPATWSAGSETGETTVGVSEWYDPAHTVHLSGGPSFVEPLWNASTSSTQGAASLRGTIGPSNAWAFVATGGVYSRATSAWAPVPASGSYWWNLTAGTYSIELLLSDYSPSTQNGLALSPTAASWLNVSLIADAARGIYTPLQAWSNAQLASISASGAGTLADPYVIENNEAGPLAPEFATFNDYAFPSYPGLLLSGTTAYVEVTNPAPFTVSYSGAYAFLADFYNLPVTNELGIQLFATSHVSVLGGTVGGWFSSNQNLFAFANLIVWNSTSTLVANVTFDDTGLSLLLYGGSGNTVSGNNFVNDPLNGSVLLGSYLSPGATYLGSTGGPLAIEEGEGGDLIYNNYFDTAVTASQPYYNIFDGFYSVYPGSFSNRWNLSAPVSANRTTDVVNGIALSGSVAGLSTVCGNWWWNLAYSPARPYDNTYAVSPGVTLAGIASGGDYCGSGLVMYPVPIVESGLPSSDAWTVDVVAAPPVTLPLGAFLEQTATSTSVRLPPGLFGAIFGLPAGASGYAPNPGTLIFEVTPGGALLTASGPVTNLSVTYSPIPTTDGTALFTETGLAPGTSWGVNVNGTFRSSSGDSVYASLPPGSYNYSLGSIYGYNATPTSGTITVVAGAVTSTPVAFTADHGWIVGSVAPGGARLSIDGKPVSVSNGAFNVSVAPGLHAVSASESGYATYANNVTVTPANSTRLTISLPRVSAQSGGFPLSPTSILYLSLGLVVLGVAIVVAVLLTRGQRRGGSPPVWVPPPGAGTAGPSEPRPPLPPPGGGGPYP